VSNKQNSIEFKVYGRYALFSDPITRVGGEKFSYQAPTYQALKGIVESVYWKPTLIWHIDAARIMRKIQTESKGIKPIKMSGGNELAYYTYLKDVEYQIAAHFEWNLNRGNLEADRNKNKHSEMAKRSIVKGGRRDIFLGTRECQGYVEPCIFGEGEGFYDSYGDLDFGIQFHGFDYPDETGKDELSVRLWKAKMTNGVIKFPSPIECDSKLRRFVREMTAKEFENKKNFTFIDEDASAIELLEDN
jgi:CRISPR-associated protein Cas5d